MMCIINLVNWLLKALLSERDKASINSSIPRREALIRKVQKHPELFQSEHAQTFGVVQSTISKAFQQLGITRKKTTRYIEADEEQRKAFIPALETLTEEQCVYLDECGIAPHLNRELGWAPRHEKVLGKIQGKREPKFNLIAILNSSELKAPLSYQGTMNTALFNTYLEEFLLPILTPGPVVIMDNATFHKSGDTHRLITGKNCPVWYLPPYSPDLNPIEHTWATLKRYIRHYRNHFDSLPQTLDFIFHSIPFFAGK